jgi:hypothetical protein
MRIRRNKENRCRHTPEVSYAATGVRIASMKLSID